MYCSRTRNASLEIAFAPQICQEYLPIGTFTQDINEFVLQVNIGLDDDREEGGMKLQKIRI